MPIYNSIPIAQRAQWLEERFGVGHDDFGLTPGQISRLSFGDLTASLHRLMKPPGEGLENGLRLLENHLEIAHGLRVKLYKALRVDPGALGLTPKEIHDAEEARDFVDSWCNALRVIASWGDQNDREKDMPPPSGGPA